jgi:hypothetical protein
MLASTKEEMESAIQDLNAAHIEEIRLIQIQVKEKDSQIAILNEDIDNL